MSLNILQAVAESAKMWRILLCVALLAAVAVPLLSNHFKHNGKIALTLELAAGSYARVLTRLSDPNSGGDQFGATMPGQRTAAIPGSAIDRSLDPEQLYSVFVFQLGDSQNFDAFGDSPDSSQFNAPERELIKKIILASDRKNPARTSVSLFGPLGERTELLLTAYIDFTARRAAAAASLAAGQFVQAERAIVDSLISSFEATGEARRRNRIAELEAVLADVNDPIASAALVLAPQDAERRNYESGEVTADDLPLQMAITPRSLRNEIAMLRHSRFSSPRLDALTGQRETLAAFDAASLDIPVFHYIGRRVQPSVFAAPLPVWVALGALSGLAIGFACLFAVNLMRQMRDQFADGISELERA